ncbi:hypothetical protein HOG98_09645 [bacterium]|nr:hypothetical protein [bacterium]
MKKIISNPNYLIMNIDCEDGSIKIPTSLLKNRDLNPLQHLAQDREYHKNAPPFISSKISPFYDMPVSVVELFLDYIQYGQDYTKLPTKWDPTASHKKGTTNSDLDLLKMIGLLLYKFIDPHFAVSCSEEIMRRGDLNLISPNKLCRLSYAYCGAEKNIAPIMDNIMKRLITDGIPKTFVASYLKSTPPLNNEDAIKILLETSKSNIHWNQLNSGQNELNNLLKDIKISFIQNNIEGYKFSHINGKSLQLIMSLIDKIDGNANTTLIKINDITTQHIEYIPNDLPVDTLRLDMQGLAFNEAISLMEKLCLSGIRDFRGVNLRTVTISQVEAKINTRTITELNLSGTMCSLPTAYAFIKKYKPTNSVTLSHLNLNSTTDQQLETSENSSSVTNLDLSKTIGSLTTLFNLLTTLNPTGTVDLSSWNFNGLHPNSLDSLPINLSFTTLILSGTNSSIEFIKTLSTKIKITDKIVISVSELVNLTGPDIMDLPKYIVIGDLHEKEKFETLSKESQILLLKKGYVDLSDINILSLNLDQISLLPNGLSIENLVVQHSYHGNDLSTCFKIFALSRKIDIQGKIIMSELMFRNLNFTEMNLLPSNIYIKNLDVTKCSIDAQIGFVKREMASFSQIEQWRLSECSLTQLLNLPDNLSVKKLDLSRFSKTSRFMGRCDFEKVIALTHKIEVTGELILSAELFCKLSVNQMDLLPNNIIKLSDLRWLQLTNLSSEVKIAMTKRNLIHHTAIDFETLTIPQIELLPDGLTIDTLDFKYKEVVNIEQLLALSKKVAITDFIYITLDSFSLLNTTEIGTLPNNICVKNLLHKTPIPLSNEILIAALKKNIVGINSIPLLTLSLDEINSLPEHLYLQKLDLRKINPFDLKIVHALAKKINISGKIILEAYHFNKMTIDEIDNLPSNIDISKVNVQNHSFVSIESRIGMLKRGVIDLRDIPLDTFDLVQIALLPANLKLKNLDLSKLKPADLQKVIALSNKLNISGTITLSSPMICGLSKEEIDSLPPNITCKNTDSQKTFPEQLALRSDEIQIAALHKGLIHVSYLNLATFSLGQINSLPEGLTVRDLNLKAPFILENALALAKKVRVTRDITIPAHNFFEFTLDEIKSLPKNFKPTDGKLYIPSSITISIPIKIELINRGFLSVSVLHNLKIEEIKSLPDEWSISEMNLCGVRLLDFEKFIAITNKIPVLGKITIHADSLKNLSSSNIKLLPNNTQIKYLKENLSTFSIECQIALFEKNFIKLSDIDFSQLSVDKVALFPNGLSVKELNLKEMTRIYQNLDIETVNALANKINVTNKIIISAWTLKKVSYRMLHLLPNNIEIQHLDGQLQYFSYSAKIELFKKGLIPFSQIGFEKIKIEEVNQLSNQLELDNLDFSYIKGSSKIEMSPKIIIALIKKLNPKGIINLSGVNLASLPKEDVEQLQDSLSIIDLNLSDTNCSASVLVALIKKLKPTGVVNLSQLYIEWAIKYFSLPKNISVSTLILTHTNIHTREALQWINWLKPVSLESDAPKISCLNDKNTKIVVQTGKAIIDTFLNYVS